MKGDSAASTSLFVTGRSRAAAGAGAAAGAAATPSAAAAAQPSRARRLLLLSPSAGAASVLPPLPLVRCAVAAQRGTLARAECLLLLLLLSTGRIRGAQIPWASCMAQAVS
jgi:hypothetical protein